MRKLSILALALATTAAAAPISDQEAWNLAVQVSDRLQPSEELQAKVKRMVGAARAAEEAVANFAIPAPGWSTTQVMIKMEEGREIAPALAPFAKEIGAYETKPFSFGNLVLLKWERPLNVPALKKELEKRPGVASVSLDSIIGRSSAVSLSPRDGGYLLTYFVGSGDCQAGCIDKKFWKFRFDGAGNLIGQEIDDQGPRRGGPGKGPGLGVMPSPGGGPTILPAPGSGLEVEPPEDPNADVSFPAPGRPGTYKPRR